MGRGSQSSIWKNWKKMRSNSWRFGFKKPSLVRRYLNVLPSPLFPPSPLPPPLLSPGKIFFVTVGSVLNMLRDHCKITHLSRCQNCPSPQDLFSSFVMPRRSDKQMRSVERKYLIKIAELIPLNARFTRYTDGLLWQFSFILSVSPSVVPVKPFWSFHG